METPAIDPEEARRREFLRFLLVSAFAHGLAVSAMLAAPLVPSRQPLPAVVSVDLVSLPPSAAPMPEPAPKPAAKPVPVPPPAKPKPEPKKVLLPKKPQREPEVKKPPPKPARPKEVEYEDVLAQLRAEQGERPAEAAPAPEAPAAPAVRPGGPGVLASAEVRAWVRAAEIHVSRAWLLAPGLKAQGLVAHVEVELDARGNVVGEPRITRRSGNPWFDESLLRAIEKASPLPPPPEPGKWVFVFDPEVYF